MDFVWGFFLFTSFVFCCLEDQDRLILGNVELCPRTLDFCSLQ